MDKNNVLRSYGDGAAYSMMVGFGETYFAAFALAVGLSQVTAGLIGSVPLIVGGALQLIAPRGARFFGSYRRWVVICAALQGLVYLPLAMAASSGHIRTMTIYGLAAIYWGCGMAAGPSWNNWIDQIIPKARLREFLAVRSRITQVAAFVAFLIGGLVLAFFEERHEVLTGFTIVFIAAGTFRLISTGFLFSQTDACDIQESLRPIPLRKIAARFREPAASRFLLFLLVSQISVMIASPFFSPYMLGHVGFSYDEYVALVSASYLSKIIFYPYVSRFAHRVGTYRALWISGICISPMPLFWFWTPQLASLIVVQVLAGISWATFELTSTLLVFDRIRADERIKILTLNNLLNAGAVVIGAAIGGAILEKFPADAAYHYMFAISAAARLLSLTVLVGHRTLKTRAKGLAFRVVGVRPSHGTLAQPIWTSREASREAAASSLSSRSTDEADMAAISSGSRL